MYPLRKCESHLTLVDPDFQKTAKQMTGSKLPSVFAATQDAITYHDPQRIACVGFKYRRQSFYCEITWLGGENPELLKEAIWACQLQSVVEGRKRVECYNEFSNLKSPRPRGGEMFSRVLTECGFKYEGRHPDWTPQMEEVEVWSWSWPLDGLPTKYDYEGVLARLAINEDVDKYFQKNMSLYENDETLTPAKIASARTEVLALPTVLTSVKWSSRV